MNFSIPAMPSVLGAAVTSPRGELGDTRQLYGDMLRQEERQRERQKALVDAARQQLDQASEAVRDLAADIEDFEGTLNADEEVQVAVIGGPAATRIFLHNLTPLGADRIRYEGVNQDGGRVVVVQHVTQLNVMLEAVAVAPLLGRRLTFQVVEGG